MSSQESPGFSRGRGSQSQSAENHQTGSSPDHEMNAQADGAQSNQPVGEDPYEYNAQQAGQQAEQGQNSQSGSGETGSQTDGESSADGEGHGQADGEGQSDANSFGDAGADKHDASDGLHGGGASEGSGSGSSSDSLSLGGTPEASVPSGFAGIQSSQANTAAAAEIGSQSAGSAGGMSPASLVNAGSSKLGAMMLNGVKGMFGGMFGGYGKALAIGAKFGMGATATSLVMALGVGGVAAGGLSLYNTSTDNKIRQSIADDSDIEDEACRPTSAQETAAFGAPGENSNANQEAEKEKTARKVYDILKPMGTSNENIAGLLGTWDVESLLDPTVVETIYDEPYQVGPKKRAAEAKGFKAAVVAPEYKAKFPSVDIMGVGIAQLSNSRGKQLQDFAKAQGSHWSDIGTNIAYFLGHDDPPDKKYFKSLVENKNATRNSPEDVAEEVTWKWERPNAGAGRRSMPDRRAAASKWFAQMASWGPGDHALSQSILAQANATVGAAAVNEVAEVMMKCAAKGKGSAGLGNASAAHAMAQYSWPTRAQAVGNNGTELYRWLHDEIFPGDSYYMSCDRSVAVGVRWSDTDSAFPAGPTITQYTHMTSSDKWEKVDWGYDVKNLRPGDIFIKGGSGGSGHVVMYLGEEIGSSKPGAKPGSDISHGSLNSRSPGIDKYSKGYLGSGKFEVFRRTGAPSESKYKDLPVPGDLNDGT